MGKLAEFQIMLEGGRQVFYPNEQLRGQVIVDLNTPMKMRNIILRLTGTGYCHWSESHGSGKNRRTHHYTGKESLVDVMSILFGNAQGQGGDNPEHPAGRYTYPFAFQLPQVLPSSVEAGIGYIRYFLKATIDKPWKFNHTTKYPVIINEIIDTNDPSYLMQPGGEVEKEVGCCCCPSGPLLLSGHTDRKAYCPGEQIIITAQAENKTTRDMGGLKAKLKKTITYHASNKSRTRSDTIATVSAGAIPKGEFANWANQVLNIPPTPPSIFNCRVVQVHYFLQIEIDVPMGFDLELKIPVILGTVPFRQTYMNALAPPVEQSVMPADTFQMAPGAPPSNIFGYPDMAPPSYASVVGENAVNITDEDVRGNLSYQPVYTFAKPYQPQ